jgi:GDPmannose 4,6-dehydratase
MKKKALIFGVTGQDGAYLSDFLIKKNYIVHGIKRRSSSFNTSRIDKIYNTHQKNGIFNLHYGDVTDSLNVQSLIQKISPDEIYNLAAQSHVKVSFETPEYTANADAIGVLRILESIKNSKKKIKFYQASTSEMYGSTPAPQSEKTVFAPVSPYGTSKLFSYWITRNYRDAYNLFACNGILFNHESPIRGETFVTRKITLAVAKYHVTGKCNLILGNINALRDWGDARDYVEGMWKMLQKKTPKDYVLATGKSYTVKKFVEEAFSVVNVKIKWRGKGLNEVGYNNKDNKILVKINSQYFRPNEVNHLEGNASKAKKDLNWKPKISLKKMIRDMVISDIELSQKT